MEFVSQLQKETYEKILPWVKELFGTFAIVREDVPVVGVMVGSALAQVGISPWGDDDTTITTRAYLVTDVEITPDLMSFLLHENDRMRFGGFGLDRDNDIFFEHTIVGSRCDKEELRSSILAVALTSDQYDDKIVERWGGRRMTDKATE